jgi:hypothetical protein
MSIYYAGAAIKKKAFSYSTASTVAALPCSSNIPPPPFLWKSNTLLYITLLPKWAEHDHNIGTTGS